MTTALATVPLALELAAESGRPVLEWQAAIAGSGGDERARWLIEHSGQRWARMTPEALVVAHTVARLLEIGPRSQVPDRSPP